MKRHLYQALPSHLSSPLDIIELAPDSNAKDTTHAFQLVLRQSIEGSFEVIQNDGISTSRQLTRCHFHRTREGKWRTYVKHLQIMPSGLRHIST